MANLKNKLSDFSEEELISFLSEGMLSSSDILRGIGEDCAVIENSSPDLLLYKTDCIVEGIHYCLKDSPVLVGRKAIARVLSDFAAMGGNLKHILLTIGINQKTSPSWLKEFYDGVRVILKENGANLVGGETISLPSQAPFFCAVNGIGVVEKEMVIFRNQAKVGDELWITGKLGGSLASGRHLTFNPRCREARWLKKNFPIQAMMDISDGLAKDLPRFAQQNHCGYQCFLDSLPLNEGITIKQGLSDGEDYELLFALAPEKSSEMLSQWHQFFELELTHIGCFCEKEESIPFSFSGFDHLQNFKDV